jgi:hypothetical protein
VQCCIPTALSASPWRWDHLKAIDFCTESGDFQRAPVSRRQAVCYHRAGQKEDALIGSAHHRWVDIPGRVTAGSTNRRLCSPSPKWRILTHGN